MFKCHQVNFTKWLYNVGIFEPKHNNKRETSEFNSIYYVVSVVMQAKRFTGAEPLVMTWLCPFSSMQRNEGGCLWGRSGGIEKDNGGAGEAKCLILAKLFC